MIFLAFLVTDFSPSNYILCLFSAQFFASLLFLPFFLKLHILKMSQFLCTTKFLFMRYLKTTKETFTLMGHTVCAVDSVFGMQIGKMRQFALIGPSDSCVIYHLPSFLWSTPRTTRVFLPTNLAYM